MSGLRPSNEKPTVYPFYDKSENSKHNFSQENKKSGEMRSTHLQRHWPQAPDVHFCLFQRIMKKTRKGGTKFENTTSQMFEQMKKMGFENPGSRTDEGPQHGAHGNPRKKCYGPHEQSRGSRTGINLQYGRPGNRPGYHQLMHYETPNLDFYQNKKRFEPNGVNIEDLLTKWKDDYKRLEVNHSYIQWLFPLQNHGRNPKAKPLTDHEIEAMKEDTAVMDRFLRAYELMLGFYGIKLKNKGTGSVTRNSNYSERFENLNNHTHNNLRITRILKCLALLGYQHFQAPLVKFFLDETVFHNNLKNVKSSVTSHFLKAVKDDKEYGDLKEHESSLRTSRESEIRNERKKVRT